MEQTGLEIRYTKQDPDASGYNMATIGKRINGNSERPSRFGLIYVEGEQDSNIKLVGSIDLGDSPFSPSRNQIQ